MEDWEKNLKERGPQRLAGLIKEMSETDKLTAEHLIFSSPCDLGVVRNGGKRGAKHGPLGLMAPFRAMVAPKTGPILHKIQTPSSSHPVDFDKVQSEELQSFAHILKNWNSSGPHAKLLHLGGGHDHVYPLGQSLCQKYGPLIIVNIDAHLDTRPDELMHSGTPFRQLLSQSQKEGTEVHLIQVGIHNFANGSENYQGLKGMEVLSWHREKEAENLEETLQEKLNPFEDATLLLSVDCDGLDASYMPAVSAPNHRGLSKGQFESVLKVCQNFWQKSSRPAVLGLYEFNPIYDGLDQGAARYLAQVMYEFFYGVRSTHE